MKCSNSLSLLSLTRSNHFVTFPKNLPSIPSKERSFLWHSASRDRRTMDEAALRLQRGPLHPAFTAEAVEAMKQLALCAAWHAANQRRFCYSDAEKDRRGRVGMGGDGGDMVGDMVGDGGWDMEMRIHMAKWRRFFAESSIKDGR